jgi:hypothetical protein
VTALDRGVDGFPRTGWTQVLPHWFTRLKWPPPTTKNPARPAFRRSGGFFPWVADEGVRQRFLDDALAGFGGKRLACEVVETGLPWTGASDTLISF